MYEISPLSCGFLFFLHNVAIDPRKQVLAQEYAKNGVLVPAHPRFCAVRVLGPLQLLQILRRVVLVPDAIIPFIFQMLGLCTVNIQNGQYALDDE